MQVAVMTFQEFSDDMFRETGDRPSRALYERYLESEAEIEAGGGYEPFDTFPVEERIESYRENMSGCGSDGRVIMTTPEHHEMEIDYFSRFDWEREQGYDREIVNDDPTEEEIREAEMWCVENGLDNLAKVVSGEVVPSYPAGQIRFDDIPF